MLLATNREEVPMGLLEFVVYMSFLDISFHDDNACFLMIFNAIMKYNGDDIE